MGQWSFQNWGSRKSGCGLRWVRESSRAGTGSLGLYSGATGEPGKGVKQRLHLFKFAFQSCPSGWPAFEKQDGKGEGPFPLSPSPSLSSVPSLEGFRISQVQVADSGIFTCVAASPAGVADRNFTLQVQGKEPG